MIHIHVYWYNDLIQFIHLLQY